MISHYTNNFSAYSTLVYTMYFSISGNHSNIYVRATWLLLYIDPIMRWAHTEVSALLLYQSWAWLGHGGSSPPSEQPETQAVWGSAIFNTWLLGFGDLAIPTSQEERACRISQMQHWKWCILFPSTFYWAGLRHVATPNSRGSRVFITIACLWSCLCLESWIHVWFMPTTLFTITGT